MTENQINEIFRLMNKAITKIDGLEIKVDGLEIKIDGLETRFDGLETRFDGLETKFDEAEKRNENFRQETKQSFDEINQKLRFMNTRAEVLIDDLMQNKIRVKDVEKRVDILEQKDAA